MFCGVVSPGRRPPDWRGAEAFTVDAGFSEAVCKRERKQRALLRGLEDVSQVAVAVYLGDSVIKSCMFVSHSLHPFYPF